MAALILLDASANKIGAVPPRRLSLTNLSAAMWGLATNLLWVVFFPLYLIRRPQLLKRAKESPQDERGVVWWLIGLAVLMLTFSAGMHKLQGWSDSQLQERVTAQLQREIGQTINELKLIRETDTKLIGFATTSHGTKLHVEVILDRNGDNYLLQYREQ
jgi:hypothetical protein